MDNEGIITDAAVRVMVMTSGMTWRDIAANIGMLNGTALVNGMEFVGQGTWSQLMISDGVWRWSLKILGYICGRLAMYVLLLKEGNKDRENGNLRLKLDSLALDVPLSHLTFPSSSSPFVQPPHLPPQSRPNPHLNLWLFARILLQRRRPIEPRYPVVADGQILFGFRPLVQSG